MQIKLFLKAQLYTLLFLLLFLGLTLLGGFGIAALKFRQFSRASGLTWPQVVEIVRVGWEQPVTEANGRVNFLILGLDSLATRGDVPALTDTMMMVSLNLENAEINTLSFPRDLWHAGYQTRINALYHYGVERSPGQPEAFPTEVLSELTGVGIHHSVVVTFDQVSQLIDLLGGIEVDVPVGFVDEQFPRSDVDVQLVHDPALLYKRIEFAQGKQMMGGEKALEYMRSRKSGDDEGTDVARGSRQQLVVDAILAKLRQKSTLTNPTLVGQLYGYYETNFARVISPTELVALGKRLWPVRTQLQVSSHNFSIFPTDPTGVIFHPEPRLYRGEWVYAVTDEVQFQQFVQAKLGVMP